MGKRSAAKRLGRGVLLLAAKKGTKGKAAKQALKFLSQSRPMIGGLERTVASFSRTELVDGVADLARTRLGRLEVDFASWATPGDAVMSVAGVADPPTFLSSAVGDLVDESAQASSTKPLSALLGADWLGSSNPIMLSADERMQRLGEGLITAIGQAHLNGIDPADLFRPPLLTYTMRYLRSHIMRNGFDHGNYSELIRAGALGKLPLIRPPRHQVAIPELTAPFSPNTGYDTILSSLDDKVAHQNKAVEFARAAMGGNINPQPKGTGWYVAKEPPILSQKTSDGLRNRPWGHQLPGSGITGKLPDKVPPGTPGWDPVNRVSIFCIDSQYLISSAWERTDDAVWRATGGLGASVADRVVNITSLDLPESVKTQLRAIVGGNTFDGTMAFEDFEQMAMPWIDGLVPTMQDELNDKLNVARLRNLINHPAGRPEVRVYASHQQDRLVQFLTELGLL